MMKKKKKDRIILCECLMMSTWRAFLALRCSPPQRFIAYDEICISSGLVIIDTELREKKKIKVPISQIITIV